jgi:hypothetical protein
MLPGYFPNSDEELNKRTGKVSSMQAVAYQIVRYSFFDHIKRAWKVLRGAVTWACTCTSNLQMVDRKRCEQSSGLGPFHGPLQALHPVSHCLTLGCVLETDNFCTSAALQGVQLAVRWKDPRTAGCAVGRRGSDQSYNTHTTE